MFGVFFMADAADKKFMQQALDLAERGRGKTSPNPMVGAVIAKKGRLISSGYHRAPGKEHAEISALNKARKAARGATLYVNLEPCSHVGRTGPCTEALIAAGVKRVVIAVKDPNPLVNGKGIRILRRAGIRVETGLMREEAWLLNDAYMGYHENRRPYVTVKLAQTIDGRIATSNGNSQWISSTESLKFVHRLRSEVDAVVVGAGTVRADNPSLTVRHVKGKNPYRIVVTGSMKLPNKFKLLNDNHDSKTIIASTERGIRRFAGPASSRNLIFWNILSNGKGGVELSDFLRLADEFGIRSLLVEGGSQLATSFLRAGLVDKFVAITAPLVLGEGVNAVGELDISALSKAIKFEKTCTFASGKDSVFVGYPKRKK